MERNWLSVLVVATCLSAFVAGFRLSPNLHYQRVSLESAPGSASPGPMRASTDAAGPAGVRISSTSRVAVVSRYRIDSSQSRFMIDADSSGLLWFLGHNHHIRARDFSGEAEITPGTLEPASLRMTVKTESLEEAGEKFTEQEKKIITDTMHKEVLETSRYPEAVFNSTLITTKKTGENNFEVKLEGDLTLHGVTRHITIPARVVLDGETLRASGKFEFDRDDFNIRTHSIKWGTIRVDDDMKLSFDIVAHK